MSLTDSAIRNAKPQEKPYKLFDSGGLYLVVAPSDGKWWRLKYRFDGKEKKLSLGVYPTITLKDARDRRDEAKKQLANGIDPSQNRKAVRSARAELLSNSFEVIAREWIVKKGTRWSESYQGRILWRLEKDVFPWLGERPIAEIKAADILPVLKRIEERPAPELAARAFQYCGQIFRYAVATSRAESDVTLSLRGALEPTKRKHMAALTEPKAVGELLRAIDGYESYFVTKCALQLAPLVFVRPGELRGAEWSEIDLDKAEWNIPAERMKMRESHLVPLSRQAVAILKEAQTFTGGGRYVFPCARTTHRPMSNNAINAALRRMGFTKDEMTGHGFRATARTILDEVLGVRVEYIEHQLAHAVRDPLGRAYNRTTHLPQRREMMQAWADYLDGLKMGAQVIPMQGRVA